MRNDVKNGNLRVFWVAFFCLKVAFFNFFSLFLAFDESISFQWINLTPQLRKRSL